MSPPDLRDKRMRKTPFERLAEREAWASAFAAASALPPEELAATLTSSADNGGGGGRDALAAMSALYGASGRVCYDLHPALVARLLDARLPGRLGAIPFPHKCILIHCPGAGFRAQEDGTKVTWVLLMKADAKSLYYATFSDTQVNGYRIRFDDKDSHHYWDVRGQPQGTKILRLALNACLYVTCHGADVVRAPGREPLPRRRKEAREPSTLEPYTKVGHVREWAPYLSRADVVAERRKGAGLRHRFPVRWHWRWQPFDKGLAHEKLICIEEHWRGPTLPEVIHSREVRVRERLEA